MARDDGKAADPLKTYCLILGFLVLVVGVLLVLLQNARSAFAEANVRAEAYLRGTGARRTADGRPSTIPDIAFEVEQYVETWKEIANQGGTEAMTGISTQMLTTMAAKVQMTERRTGGEATDTNATGGYATTTLRVYYEKTTLQNLLKLLYNVEAVARYRVRRLSWRLSDAKENATPPFNRIEGPELEIAVRRPVARER
jgi:hypothetical protein